MSTSIEENVSFASTNVAFIWPRYGTVIEIIPVS